MHGAGAAVCRRDREFGVELAVWADCDSATFFGVGYFLQQFYRGRGRQLCKLMGTVFFLQIQAITDRENEHAKPKGPKGTAG